MSKKYDKETKTQAFHLQAKKSLGQNFLRDADLIEKIAESIDVLETKYVHEIGPGSGALSSALLKRGIKVTAIEKDGRCVEGLSATLVKEYPGQFKVIQADILQWSPAEDKNFSQPVCVGNLPYYITSPILLWFCKFYKYYQCGVFMVQNEVADRLQAKVGTKDYGRLTVKIQLFFSVEKLFVVDARSFVPRPKVDSALVRLVPTGFSFASVEEENAFEKFTALIFSARRKMLRRALAVTLEEIEKKEAGTTEAFWSYAYYLGVHPETRPDSISPEVILALHRFFNLTRLSNL